MCALLLEVRLWNFYDFRAFLFLPFCLIGAWFFFVLWGGAFYGGQSCIAKALNFFLGNYVRPTDQLTNLRTGGQIGKLHLPSSNRKLFKVVHIIHGWSKFTDERGEMCALWRLNHYFTIILPCHFSWNARASDLRANLHSSIQLLKYGGRRRVHIVLKEKSSYEALFYLWPRALVQYS